MLPEPGEFEREGFRDETPNPPFMGQPDWLGSLGGLGALGGLVDTGLFGVQIETPVATAEPTFGTPQPFAPSSLEAFSLDEGGPGTVDHAKALAALEEENRRLKAQVEEIYAERQRKVQLFREVVSGGVYWLLSRFEPGTLFNTYASKQPIAASSDWILKSAQDLAGRLKQQPTAAQQMRTEFPKTGEAF